MLGYQLFVLCPLQVAPVIREQGVSYGVNVPIYGSGSSTNPKACDSVSRLVFINGRLFFKVRMKGRTTVMSRKMSRMI